MPVCYNKSVERDKSPSRKEREAMKIFKKNTKTESKKVRVTLLNLFNKEIEVVETYEDGLNVILCHGFDILKVEII